jgi:hypothetical protein
MTLIQGSLPLAFTTLRDLYRAADAGQLTDAEIEALDAALRPPDGRRRPRRGRRGGSRARGGNARLTASDRLRGAAGSPACGQRRPPCWPG